MFCQLFNAGYSELKVTGMLIPKIYLTHHLMIPIFGNLLLNYFNNEKNRRMATTYLLIKFISDQKKRW